MKVKIIPYNLSEVQVVIRLIKTDSKISFIELGDKFRFFDSNCELLKSYPNFLLETPEGNEIDPHYLLRYLVNLESVLKRNESVLEAIKLLSKCGEDYLETTLNLINQLENDCTKVISRNLLKEIEI